MKIYQATMTLGTFDDQTSEDLYIGLDYEQAKSVLLNFPLPKYDNIQATIYIWEDGKLLKSEYVIERHGF